MLYIDKHILVFSSSLLLKTLRESGLRPVAEAGSSESAMSAYSRLPQWLVELGRDTAGRHSDTLGQGNKNNRVQVLYKASATIRTLMSLRFLIAFILIISFGLHKHLMKEGVKMLIFREL